MIKLSVPNYLVAVITLLMLASCGNNKKTEKAGAPLQTSYIEVSIGGMTCTGCEQKIQASVGKLEGIRNVKASHIDANAVIEYTQGNVDTLKIKDAIAAAGYTVKKFKNISQN